MLRDYLARGQEELRDLIGEPRPQPMEWALAGLLVLAAFATRFHALGLRVMSHDESEHAYFSWLLAQGQGYQHTPLTHGPLQFHLIALSQWLLGDSDFTTRIPVALAGVLGVAALFLYRRWLGRWGATAAMAFMLLSPYMLYYTRYARNEGLIIPISLFMFLALFRYFETRRDGWLYAFAASLTLHYLAKETAFLYAAELSLFLGAWWMADLWRASWPRGRERRLFFGALPAALLGGGVAAALFLRSRTTGEPLEGALGLSIGLGLGIAGAAGGLMLYGAIRAFRERLRTQSAALDALVVCLILTLPQLAALPATLLGWDPLNYTDFQIVMRTAATAGVMLVATVLLAALWSPRRFLPILAIFFVPYVLFYTTFFTNLTYGIPSGLVGSFGYWLAQQEVQRGSQPWYYYLALQIPFYEYAAAAGAVWAAALGIRRRLAGRSQPAEPGLPAANRPFPCLAFLGYWSLASLAAFSYAGERMPWLTVHIALPMIPLAGWALGEMLRSTQARRRAPALGALALGTLLLLSGRTAFMASYLNHDYANEFLVYAHGERGVRLVMERIEQVAQASSAGYELEIAYDTKSHSGNSGVSWPFTWYLRNYPNATPFGPQITAQLLNKAVLIVSNDNWARVDALTEGAYQVFEYNRMVWPMQDYFGLTWGRIERALLSPQMRRALWDIWFHRDYRLYGELTNQDLSLEKWRPSDRMRLYVRDDFAWATWQIGDPTKVRRPEEADPYLEGMQQLQADWILGPSEDVEWPLQRPRGLAIAPDGSLYVADSGGQRVYRISPQGHLLASWGGFAGGENAPPGKFNEPWGLAVAPDGSVYVADTWNFRIQRFTPQGEFLDMWGSPGTGEILNALWGPRAVVVDEEGRVFVADTGNKRIVVFDPQGIPLDQIGGPGSGPGQFDEPVGLAIGPQGTLYVADTWNRRIQAFAQGQDGTFQPVASWGLQAWFGQSLENKPYLAVGPEGQVCTTDPEAARILCFDARGDFLFGWALDGQGLGQPPLPVGIAISPQGHVWVSDSGSGRLLGFLVDWPARVPGP
jgi:uncharacterized protein (TIGR03663 family)